MSKWSAVNRLECSDRRLRIYRIVLDEPTDHVGEEAKGQKETGRLPDVDVSRKRAVNAREHGKAETDGPVRHRTSTECDVDP
jgi:hypothetical protein